MIGQTAFRVFWKDITTSPSNKIVVAGDLLQAWNIASTYGEVKSIYTEAEVITEPKPVDTSVFVEAK